MTRVSQAISQFEYVFAVFVPRLLLFDDILGLHSHRLFLGQPDGTSASRPNRHVLTYRVKGKHFSLVQPEDLLLVDHDGQIQNESGPLRLLNTAAFMIHSAIHAARPDVNCAAHSHSVYGRAFSTLGRELEPLTQDACAFYNVGHSFTCLFGRTGRLIASLFLTQDHVVYRSYGGVVLEAEEGKNIARLLGKKKVCRMATLSPNYHD